MPRMGHENCTAWYQVPCLNGVDIDDVLVEDNCNPGGVGLVGINGVKRTLLDFCYLVQAKMGFLHRQTANLFFFH